VLCPRSAGEPCALHGWSYDHRTAVRPEARTEHVEQHRAIMLTGGPMTPSTETLTRLEELDELARGQNAAAANRAREHLVGAGRWLLAHRSLTVCSGLLAAVAGGSIFANATGGWKTVSGFAAILAAVFAGADSSLGAAGRAQEHKIGVDGYTALRTKWLLFYKLRLTSGDPIGILEEELTQLIDERDTLQAKTPAISASVKKRAKELKQREKADESEDGPAP
jgi:hypothetical protein